MAGEGKEQSVPCQSQGGQLPTVQPGVVPEATTLGAAPDKAIGVAKHASDSVVIDVRRAGPKSPQAKIFETAASLQRKDRDSSKGAEHAHTQLSPALWGISKAQLQQFVHDVRGAMESKDLVNMSLAECIQRGHREWYYEQAKFDNPEVGPNMHIVNNKVIKPHTCLGDPVHGIPFLSYALMKNSLEGLMCDLFVSHAWDEGLFEFSKFLLSQWPQECRGAYICFLSNPQNLPELIGKMIQRPCDSPFHKVLESRPALMLMVPNSNTPIHSRLWCVYEAYCAMTLTLPVKIAGDPELMVTDRAAADKAKKLARDRRRLMWGVSIVFFFGVLFSAGGLAIPWMFAMCYLWRKHKAAKAAILSVIDVTKAQCTSENDKRMICKEIKGNEQAINDMIRKFIGNLMG